MCGTGIYIYLYHFIKQQLEVIMLALLVLVIFAMLVAAPCIKLKTGPNPDDLEYIGDNRYRHKKTGEIYRWDQDIGAS